MNKENREAKVVLNEGTTHIETSAPVFITGGIEHAADLAVVRIGFLKSLVANMDHVDLGQFKDNLVYTINKSGNYEELISEVEDALNYQKMLAAIQEYDTTEYLPEASDEDLL